MKLLLVRHGQCESNLGNRFQGQVDSPLTELGRRQARAAAERLKREPIAALYSSDLSRARDTAAPIAEALGRLPVHPTPLLRECHIGNVQGWTRDEFRERYPDLCARWEADPIAHRPPGAERFEEVIERCGEFIVRLSRPWPAIYRCCLRALRVSGLICAALDLPVSSLKFHAANASLSILEAGAAAALHVLNDTSHLRGL